MSAGISALLSRENLAFIQQGVSINVASRDVRMVPSLARAMGCRLSDDGSALRVSLARPHARELIRDVERSSALAVVFSQPSTHKSLQIKGSDARICSPEEADWTRHSDNSAAFAAEIGQLGFSLAFSQCLFAAEPGDLVIIEFTPSQVFEQTPGPHAGEPLESHP